MAGAIRSNARQRFAVGEKVRTGWGVVGVVTALEDEPTGMGGEYRHNVEYSVRGEVKTRMEFGSNLEPISEPISSRPRESPRFGDTIIHQYGAASRAYVGSQDHSVNSRRPT